jgi:hypothetical protein
MWEFTYRILYEEKLKPVWRAIIRFDYAVVVENPSTVTALDRCG